MTAVFNERGLANTKAHFKGIRKLKIFEVKTYYFTSRYPSPTCIQINCKKKKAHLFAGHCLNHEIQLHIDDTEVVSSPY